MFQFPKFQLIIVQKRQELQFPCLKKKMIKSTPVIQKFRHGLNLNTASTLLPRVRKRFNFCRMRKFRAWILHHVFDCLGHANAMPTICRLKDLLRHILMIALDHNSESQHKLSIKSQHKLSISFI